MLKAMVRNAKYKYAVVLCTVIVTLFMLIKIEGFTALEAVRIFFGGAPLGRIVLLLAFVMCIALIQYINVDTIMCLLKNNTYFLVRYEKRKLLLNRLYTNIFFLNAIFIGVIIFAYGISVITLDLTFSWMECLEILLLSFRGFLMCIGCSLVQVILMVKHNETDTFMIMTVFSVLCAFISRIMLSSAELFQFLPAACRMTQRPAVGGKENLTANGYNMGIFILFPTQLSGKNLYVNLIICFLYIAAEIAYCNNLYCSTIKISK